MFDENMVMVHIFSYLNNQFTTNIYIYIYIYIKELTFYLHLP